MAADRDYSEVVWPWDGDPNWDQPREGATYDVSDEKNWAMSCSVCKLHFPMDLELEVVAGHWQGHHPGWTPIRQEPKLALNLTWIGLGTPPQPPEAA